METSSCIISPLKVNFLLNGKGVERRINVCMDTGPQIPTTVEHMLKYGTNLLQAVGQFNGNYIIVVAFMSVISNPVGPALPDFVQPAVAALDSDSDIIEGPSRISLNCPISFRRINTPVKGHLCKHLHCFDFDNFMDINSRRPSWRCPHCNQFVCFPDIRIDQNMVKVLKEVGENAADVIISADGSWKAVRDSDDQTDKPHDKAPIGPVQQNTCFLNASSDILDLTEGDNEMDVISTCKDEDRKPSLANSCDHSNVTNQTSEFNRNIASHIEDDFWTGIYLSSHGIVISNSGSDTQIIGGASESASANTTMLSSVLTDAISPALNQELEVFQRSSLISSSGTHRQVSHPNNMQLQQYGNSNTSNEYGRFPPIVARHVSRTPIAVQALPAQTSAGVSGNVERRQQFSRSHLTSPSLSQHMGSQNWGNQDRSFISSQPAQQLGGLPAPTQQPSAYLGSPALPTDHLNSHQQRSLNQRIPHTISQSSSLVRSSAPHLPRTQIHQGGIQSGVGPMTGPGSSQQALYIAHARAAQMGRQSPSMPAQNQASRSSSLSVPVNADAIRASVGEQRGNMGVPDQSVPRADSSLDVSAEQNWRPTGRMRGSLSGRAYSDALSQYIIQPTQPVPAARPNIIARPGLPPQLQALMANSRNANSSQEGSHPVLDTSMSEGSGFLPAQSSGMH